jgi:CRP/FNR family transcriptional regulator
MVVKIHPPINREILLEALDADDVPDHCTSIYQCLISYAVPRHFQADQVIFLDGEPCKGLYVVQDGWIKTVKIHLSGREQIVRVVGPGEMFNIACLFLGSATNLVTAIALEEATAWVIPRKTLEYALEECPHLIKIIARHLAAKVSSLITLVEDLSLRKVNARLARLLLEQSVDDEFNRAAWVTQAGLAARIGTVPDVINRALRSLADEGYIRVARDRIQILNRPGLVARTMLDI